MIDSERLQLYKDLLLRWSARVNLIGPEAKRNLDAHVDEAVAATRLLEPRGEVLDVGSGGGLPAIPMAILSPEARFHLVEADQKKWAFLKHVVRECALSSVIYGDRLEHVAPGFSPDLQFSLVTSRAVGQGERWIPLVAPSIAAEGCVALFEGEQGGMEIEGFRLKHRFELPRGERNYLSVYERFHVKQDG